MSEIPEGKICVYRHIRNDTHQPFYIGIGNSSRPYTIKGRNNHWKRIYDKVGGDYEVQILFENVSIEFARLKEIELIGLYGRRGSKVRGLLCNQTDGGEMLLPIGSRNGSISEETKARFSAMYKGKKRTCAKPFVSQMSRDRSNVKNSKYIFKKISLITGEVIEVFFGGDRAAKSVNGFVSALHRSAKDCTSYKGFNWVKSINEDCSERTKNKKHIESTSEEVKNILRAKNSKYNNIKQIDKDTGIVIDVFASSYVASSKVGTLACNILKCINGERNTAGGFKWTADVNYEMKEGYRTLGSDTAIFKTINDREKRNEEYRLQLVKYLIRQIDNRTGVVVGEFIGLTEAVNATGCSKSGIHAALDREFPWKKHYSWKTVLNPLHKPSKKVA